MNANDEKGCRVRSDTRLREISSQARRPRRASPRSQFLDDNAVEAAANFFRHNARQRISQRAI
jgi:hypothetical protein